jgi:hypothetical protein
MPDTTAARPSQDTRSSLDRRPPPAASHLLTAKLDEDEDDRLGEHASG